MYIIHIYIGMRRFERALRGIGVKLSSVHRLLLLLLLVLFYFNDILVA